MQRRACSPKDHAPNYFYQVTNESQMYRKNLGSQLTDIQNVPQSARLSAVTPAPPSQASAANSPGRILNYQMQNKYFHQSNIFDGVQYPKEYQERSALNPPAPVRAKSSHGSVINNGYNVTALKNQPIVDTSKTVQLEFNCENNHMDQLELKRALIKQGLQITELNMKNPLNVGRTKNEGSITVRGQEESIQKVGETLEKFGLKASQKSQKHTLAQHNKVWLSQKQTYEKIGYFQKNSLNPTYGTKHSKK